MLKVLNALDATEKRALSWVHLSADKDYISWVRHCAASKPSAALGNVLENLDELISNRLPVFTSQQSLSSPDMLKKLCSSAHDMGPCQHHSYTARQRFFCTSRARESSDILV